MTKTIAETWDAMSIKQKLYLVIMQGILAMMIDFGLNYLFSWLMYRTAVAEGKSIPVWGWPNLIGGHIFVETIIQSVLTWVIVGALVRG